MRVLGVDLAAGAATTGAVLLVPGSDNRWSGEALEGVADDDRLVEAARQVDVVGVDAPLRWPRAFVAAVGAHEEFGAWPGSVDRSRLTHRDTDRVVRRLGVGSPVSVSADKLGSVAMRCALLQHRWGLEVWATPAPRDGSGPLVETYPAAALAAWHIDCRGYNDRRQLARAALVRERTLDTIARATAHWLDLTAVHERCAASDHVLDAVVCCLVAVAAHGHLTHGPSSDERPAALIEGWIHVPSVDLSEIVPPAGG